MIILCLRYDNPTFPTWQHCTHIPLACVVACVRSCCAGGECMIKPPPLLSNMTQAQSLLYVESCLVGDFLFLGSCAGPPNEIISLGWQHLG